MAEESDGAAEGSGIESNIAGASRSLLDFIDANHRYWGLWRYSRGSAMPIAIQHKITSDEYSNIR
jgi:hypothetical protein